jgi:ketosteroid isomerase-like protein
MRIDRTFVVAMFIASGLSACSKTPAAFSDADRTSIQAAVDSFTNAIKSGDYAAAASWYTVDAVFMPPNAPVVEGRPAIQKTLESFGKVSAFSQPVVEVDGVGDLAYARVNFDLTFTPPSATTPISDKG